MEYIAIVLAVIAILNDIFLMKKSHSYTIKDKYFCEIFDEVLITKIPNAYMKITDAFIPNKMFQLNQEILDTILSLKQKIYFFRFYDKCFYNKVNDLLIELDENVHKYCGSSHQSYHDNKLAMDECIEELYNYINSYNLK